MLSVKIAGSWLATIGAYGPVTVEFGQHGSEAASWSMSPEVAHPLLRGGSRVEVFDGGFRIWVGTLVEPGSGGEYSAIGIWRQAERAPALNTSGAYSTVPNDVLVGAFSRGEIAWGYVNSISAAPWASGSGDLSVADVLNGLAAESGTNWIVSPRYEISLHAAPTTPTWHVPHAVYGRGLTPAEDEFATHLVGTFLISDGVYGYHTVGSTEAAAAFGRRSIPVDLTPAGFIDSARANSILTGMFLKAGARMGWAETLELGHGQIVTPGGVPASLSQVQAGQMVRLRGVVDQSRANRLPAYTDVIIASSTYTDGSGTISLTPLGYAARTLSDVLTIAVEGE